MNTTDFGWPMSSPVKTVGSKYFWRLVRDLVLLAISKGAYTETNRRDA